MEDEQFMRLAIKVAERGRGLTSPNPTVGAVIVRNGRVLARGYHRQAGAPHAEIEALRALGTGSRARGATIYVTLEPCSTHGRTPPCTDAIRRAGFRTGDHRRNRSQPRATPDAGSPKFLTAARARRARGCAGVRNARGSTCAFNRWIVTGKTLGHRQGGAHARRPVGATAGGKPLAERSGLPRTRPPAARPRGRDPHRRGHPARG